MKRTEVWKMTAIKTSAVSFNGCYSFMDTFAFMWTTISDKNQNFEMFGQMFFKQNSKISGIHQYIILFLR